MTIHSEPHRPQIHYTPAAGWQNDPNGLVYYDGEYHLFYQYNSIHNGFGAMNWGHAVSRNLIHWEELPIAIPYDQQYIWSGSAVVDSTDCSGFFGGSSGMVAFFTYADDDEVQTIALAYSADRGRTWTKYEGNPILHSDGEKAFRDPKVFYHEPTGRWIMVVAGGYLRFYSSVNLRDWTLESTNRDLWTECPDFFSISAQCGEELWVLDRAGKGFTFGRFDGHSFEPGYSIPDDTNSPDRYAAQVFTGAPAGRLIEVSWFGSWKYQDTPVMKERLSPFNGGVTFPVELTFCRDGDGNPQLRKFPVAELKKLRCGTLFSFTNADLGKDDLPVVSYPSSGATEIIARFNAEQSFIVMLSCKNGSGITLGYDSAARELFVDRTHSGMDLPEYNNRYAKPLSPDHDGNISLHVLLDRHLAETFGNDGVAEIAANVMMPETEYTTVLTTDGDTVHAAELTVNHLKQTW